jgi:polysaccharide pyruvyl transferase WcaK-like protein
MLKINSNAKIGILYGFYGSNHGDRAVTRGGIQLLRNAGFSGNFCLISPTLSLQGRAGLKGTLSEFNRTKNHIYNLSLSGFCSPQNDPQSILDEIMSSESMTDGILNASQLDTVDLVVFGGGEQLFSYDQASSWTLCERILPLLCAHRAKIPIAFLPSTFGPFFGNTAVALLGEMIREASVILSRDSSSYNYLKKKMGVQTELGADNAFFLEHSYFKRKMIRPRGPQVALVPRLESYGLRAGATKSRNVIQSARKSDFRNTVAFQLYYDLAVNFIKQGSTIGIFIQSDADVELCQMLERKINSDLGGVTTKIHNPSSLKQYVRELSFYDVAVTSRFHSAIFSIQSEILPVGIYFEEHGWKMPGLFEMLGITDLLWDGRRAVAAEIVKCVNDSITTNYQYSSEIHMRSTAIKDQTLRGLSNSLLGVGNPPIFNGAWE